MTQESILINDEEHKLADLSDEDKGLIDLWITAKNKFEEHRKQAAIHEYAAMNFANMISSRVNGNGRPEVLGS